MNQTPSPQVIIEAFPAHNGDCFLVSSQNYYLLVDTGYEDTYTDYLKPRFTEIKASGNRLDRVIITHIDEDHIHGAIPFIEANGTAEDNHIIAIEQVWHNSYRHLHQAEKKTEISPEGQRQLARLNKGESSVGEPVSARQGSSLAALLIGGKYA